MNERRNTSGTLREEAKEDETRGRGKCSEVSMGEQQMQGGVDAERGDSSTLRIRNTCIPVVYGD